MKKHSVNRRLREELSPDRSLPYNRSASPTSSTSSRDTSRHRNRRRSRSPYRHPGDEKQSWGEGYRNGVQFYRSNAPHSIYEGRFKGTDARSSRNYESGYARKRSPPASREGHPVKKSKVEYGVQQNEVAGNDHGERNSNRLGPKHESDRRNLVLREQLNLGAGDAARTGKPHFSDNVSVEGKAKSTDSASAVKSRLSSFDEIQCVPPHETHQVVSANLFRSRKSPAIATREPTSNAVGNEPSKNVDEQGSNELSVEERRKRREAIRAKFKNQSTDLRVQAFENNSASAATNELKTAAEESSTCGDQADSQSNPATPFTGEISPQSSPCTPAENGLAPSPEPIIVENDTDLANTSEAVGKFLQGEEPSAADYDPTEAMREDRIRHDKRIDTETVPSGDYEEVNESEHQFPIPGVGVSKPSGDAESMPEPAADDMFASDDEDDMFAAEPRTKTAKPGNSKDAAKAKGTEIDTSMLDNWDDPDGYYRPILGETLDGRYQIQSNLGKGMFSGVVRATDLQSKHMKAIKIIRNNESMVKAAQKEMAILKKLAESDPDDKKHLVRLERSFSHRDHLCLVFENLSLNLREVLKKFGRDVGINIKAIRSYAQQMFLALGLMRKCNIYHADLKPDNILVTEDRASLKICDLGSAGDGSEFEIAPYLVSRYYRAPEIILGCPYDFAIDMWSIGCTLYELFTGKILFTGRDNNGMLRNIMETRGKISVKMLKKAEFGALYFDDANLYFRSTERDRITNREVVKLLNFQKPTRELKDRILAAAPKDITEVERKELLLFADLLDKCLMLNPERRLTPAEALKHPFIHRGFTPIGLK
ncbi:MAG: hypothetical protein Q9162_006727 [Coniocarpon cinnabarinum]